MLVRFFRETTKSLSRFWKEIYENSFVSLKCDKNENHKEKHTFLSWYQAGGIEHCSVSGCTGNLREISLIKERPVKDMG